MLKLGMRNIKTGIAVFLATVVGCLGLIQTPIYTVSVCIFSIKNTVKGSLDNSISRILGTLLGGFVGYLFALLFGGKILLTSFGVVLVIHLCKIFKIADSAGIASVTFAAILLGVGDADPLMYSTMRTIDTLVGVLIALLVNFWISRRRYLIYLCTEFKKSSTDCIELVSHMIKIKEYKRYSDLDEMFSTLKMYYTQIVDEIVYSNESGDLGNIKLRFDICEQLLHHIHGLYLIEKNRTSASSVRDDLACKYHLTNLEILLNKVDTLNVDIQEILEKKTA